MNKLVFTTSTDKNFSDGCIGLVKSIRKFYSNDEADIVVFMSDDCNDLHKQLSDEYNCDCHYFNSIEKWVVPLVYSTGQDYLENTKHYYHPQFKIEEGNPSYDENGRHPKGFSIHHLHPLNVKAYCTGYCICIKEYEKVVHIDCDSFLLSKIDDLYIKNPDPNQVIAFWEDNEKLPHHKVLYGMETPENSSDYGINGGVVFYTNGDGVKKLALEFMYYIDSCYHYYHSGNHSDQGVLRALIALHDKKENIKYVKHDKKYWNPTWGACKSLTFNNDEWFNEGNKQYIYHGAGNAPGRPGHALRAWTDSEYASDPSIIDAWKWVGGTVLEKDFMNIKGDLPRHRIELVANLMHKKCLETKNFSPKILEIGTRFGRTSIAFATILLKLGIEPSIDTLDVYTTTYDYRNIDDVTTENAVKENISLFKMDKYINPMKIDGCENLTKLLGKYDIIYIDGDHRYKHVYMDCRAASRMIKENGIIIGDDYGFPGVREAVNEFFSDKFINNKDEQWWITI